VSAPATFKRPRYGHATHAQGFSDLRLVLPLLMKQESGLLPFRRHDSGASADAALGAGVREAGHGVLPDGVDAQLREHGHDAVERLSHRRGGIDLPSTAEDPHDCEGSSAAIPPRQRAPGIGVFGRGVPARFVGRPWQDGVHYGQAVAARS
jgi:hypothetical protein